MTIQGLVFLIVFAAFFVSMRSYRNGYIDQSFLPLQKEILVSKFRTRFIIKPSKGITVTETTVDIKNVSPNEGDVESLTFYSMKEFQFKVKELVRVDPGGKIRVIAVEGESHRDYVEYSYPYINVTERAFESEVEFMELLGIIKRDYLNLYDQSDIALNKLKGLHLAESRSDTSGVLHVDEEGKVGTAEFYTFVHNFEKPLKYGETRTLRFINSYRSSRGRWGDEQVVFDLGGATMMYYSPIPQSMMIFIPSSESEKADISFQFYIPESRIINATFEYSEDHKFHYFSPNDENIGFKYRFARFMEIGPFQDYVADLSKYVMRLKVNVNFTTFRTSHLMQYGEYDSLVGIGMKNKRGGSIKETCEQFLKEHNNTDIPRLTLYYNTDQIDGLTNAIVENSFSELFYEVDFKYCFEYISKFCDTSDLCEVDDEKSEEEVDFFMMVLNSFVVYSREVIRNLIGLEEIKHSILSMMKGIIFQEKLRIFSKRKVILGEERNYHLIFKGNPGSGKTTVARIMGKIFHALGIIRKDRFVEVQRGDLVAGYVGQTAIKTKQIIDGHRGGVILVDEAYSLLYSESGNDYGAEALSVIMKEMNVVDDSDKTLFIFAGYKKEMEEFLKKANMGFRRRIHKAFQFEDYSIEELTQIFLLKMNGTSFVLEESANDPKKILNWFSESGELNDMEIRSMNNGGLVNRIIDRIIQVHVNSLPMAEKEVDKLLMINERSILTALRLCDAKTSFDDAGFWNFTL